MLYRRTPRAFGSLFGGALLLSLQVACFEAPPGTGAPQRGRGERLAPAVEAVPSAERSARGGARALGRDAVAAQRRGGRRLSATAPPINLTHLFEGEINRRGKPVGFHGRPGGVDPAGARVVRVIDGPNRDGVYVARVEIRDTRSGRWLGKTSTFYPDAMSEAEIVAAVLAAFRASNGGESWRGPSGLGFSIEGYYQDGRINTAYPVYRRGRG